jgi:hypothetical protein
MSKLHTEVVPAQHNTRHKANVRQTDEKYGSNMKKKTFFMSNGPKLLVGHRLARIL